MNSAFSRWNARIRQKIQNSLGNITYLNIQYKKILKSIDKKNRVHLIDENGYIRILFFLPLRTKTTNSIISPRARSTSLFIKLPNNKTV